MEKGEITLMTLGGGVAQELFAREMAKVLASIADPNTEPDAPREITLKVRFKRRIVAFIKANSKIKVFA